MSGCCGVFSASGLYHNRGGALTSLGRAGGGGGVFLAVWFATSGVGFWGFHPRPSDSPEVFLAR